MYTFIARISHPVQTPRPYIYNIPVLTIVGILSETLRQAPSLSTATQASPPIVILTGLFEAHSRSSVYLDFTAPRQWGRVISTSMTHVGLTSESTTVLFIPLASVLMFAQCPAS
ncbi:hypothetical protein ARMSODRAFT_133005 [Armillaria solidipes]|uniref:Uncharacterized protein n=1 Tax=Armillaria solidipes TaxID=1076256 RepID=A0A2H3AHJ1_9AGAR|nr:hypothetical protein ARMSODRAFT_133005 [Armillaria solidipes]